MLRSVSPVPTWMVWNTVLALVPLALSITLFSPARRIRSVSWWVGLAAFFAVLPNAPYVLTDSASWASPRALLAVALLAIGLATISATLRLATIGARTAARLPGIR